MGALKLISNWESEDIIKIQYEGFGYIVSISDAFGVVDIEFTSITDVYSPEILYSQSGCFLQFSGGVCNIKHVEELIKNIENAKSLIDYIQKNIDILKKGILPS